MWRLCTERYTTTQFIFVMGHKCKWNIKISFFPITNAPPACRYGQNWNIMSSLCWWIVQAEQSPPPLPRETPHGHTGRWSPPLAIECWDVESRVPWLRCTVGPVISTMDVAVMLQIRDEWLEWLVWRHCCHLDAVHHAAITCVMITRRQQASQPPRFMSETSS